MVSIKLIEGGKWNIKMVSVVMLLSLVMGMLTLAFDIQPVEAATIIVPWDYPTIQEAINAASNGDTIKVAIPQFPPESVIVNKSVTLFGYGFAFLDGAYVAADNVSIRGFNIASYGSFYPYGPVIVLEGVSGCNILEVSISDIDEADGIILRNSSHNIIANNTIDTIQVGGGAIFLESSHNNTIVGNTIKANWDPSIYLKDSSGNKFFNNNFYTYWAGHLKAEGNSTNVWSAGYPDGGNYWNDYNGTDYYSAPHQNETGSDRIGDTPYVIDANNTDNYPLMSPTPWDLTGPIQWLPDGKCDIRDIARVASLFGSLQGDGRYDLRADITGPTYLEKDDKIDIRDVALVARHFGE